MMEISFQRLKLESGRALIMETDGVRGHICSWGWLTSLARLSHGLSWKSKDPKSMRTEYAGIHSRFHPFWVPFFLLFACVCVFVLTVTVKGWVSVGGLLKSPSFTVSFWGFFLSGGLDMISTNQCLSMKLQWSPKLRLGLLDHVCENESEKTFKFAIVNIIILKPPSPFSFFCIFLFS